MSLFLNPWRPSIAIWPPSIIFRSNEFSVLRIAAPIVGVGGNSLAFAKFTAFIRFRIENCWFVQQSHGTSLSRQQLRQFVEYCWPASLKLPPRIAQRAKISGGCQQKNAADLDGQVARICLS